jgi:uncharacterized protein (TIGR03083 family)
MAVDHVEVTALSSGAFTEVVSTPGALGVAVPSCPGWTVADLVQHLGQVQDWWALALRGNGSRPRADDLSAPGADLLSWWRQRSDDFLTTLRATPADAPAWCWWNEAQRDTAGVVAWRQAHEAVVHLWDAQSALGTPDPISEEVAADGVDEFVARMLPASGWEGVLRLRTDDRVWTFDRGAQSRATTISGSAEQLYLMLWRRTPLHDLTVVGDGELATAFLAWPNLG